MSRNSTQPPDSFLTIAEAADYLRCSTSFLYRAVADGEVRVHRFGKAIRITPDDLDALIAASAEGALTGRPVRGKTQR